MTSQDLPPIDPRARVAIDLGAESCRVSLLRWRNNRPVIELVHRIPNGPVRWNSRLVWPLDAILSGLDEGLRKAAEIAPEGIASIAADGWAVDYVRLDPAGQPLYDPFCYRDERTVAAKAAVDTLVAPEELFRAGGAQPLRINTLYQLFADAGAGADTAAPWLCLPEYVLYWLGGRRVAEYTNATHTGLVDLNTGDWSRDLFARLNIPIDAAPPIVPAGSVVGRVRGQLAALDAFRQTDLIAPACHDTASAIAGIAVDLHSAAYICSGTWSLVGTLTPRPLTTSQALEARFTNQGAAPGGFCFHTNLNGMWLIKQCIDDWSAQGRSLTIENLVTTASACAPPQGLIDVDAEPLLLDGHMQERINQELARLHLDPIPDTPGNEPQFARLIFESLATRYASAIRQLEQMVDRPIHSAHILGGGSRNQLLLSLTAQYTGLRVTAGHPESSTIGNFAVQLATAESRGQPLARQAMRDWAVRLAQP